MFAIPYLGSDSMSELVDYGPHKILRSHSRLQRYICYFRFVISKAFSHIAVLEVFRERGFPIRHVHYSFRGMVERSLRSLVPYFGEIYYLCRFSG